MITLIYILLLLALFHYIYESALLPSIRLNYRYRLFSLRDELRRLKFENRDLIDDRLYNYLQTSVNVTVNILHRIDLGMVLKTHKRYEEDKEFHQRIERRRKLIDDLLQKCEVSEIVEVRKKYLRTLEYVFFANTGALYIYLVPIAILLACLDKLKSFIKDVSTIREREVDEISPAYST